MEPDKNYHVELSKDFTVAADRLYEAWTKPEALKQWWKPMNNSLAEVTNELKPGGNVRYVFENGGLAISGQYDEVKENEKLSYSWNWEFPAEALKNASYQLTISFHSAGTGSSIHIQQDGISDDEGVLVHQQGWEKALTDLEQYVSGTDGNANDKPDYGNTGTDRSGGYNESPEQVKVGGG